MSDVVSLFFVSRAWKLQGLRRWSPRVQITPGGVSCGGGWLVCWPLTCPLLPLGTPGVGCGAQGLESRRPLAVLGLHRRSRPSGKPSAF